MLAAGAVLALALAAAGTAGVRALVTGAQIKDGTIRSRDIANGTIRARDLAQATIASLRGQRGPAGARGATGATGAQGPAGPQGPAGSQGATGARGATGPAGPAGPQGDPGAGVEVTGSVATEDDLPTDADLGDAYIVTDTGDLWIWDGGDWVDTGPVRGPEGPEGPQGPAGPQGPQGPAGPQGAAGGLSGYEVVAGEPVPISAEDFDVEAVAMCPPGKVVLGGGATVDDPSVLIGLVSSFPVDDGDALGWDVVVRNDDGLENGVTAYAVCADEAA
jgi:hypothetical protein